MGKLFFSKLVLCISLFYAATAAFAGFWDWSTPYQGPNKDILTLVVTGNYTKPRLLADLIQEEIRQPYLLLPTQPGGKIFFIPVKGEALEVREGDVTKFVKFINPRRILVLGDSSYVPERYLNLIDKFQTIVVIRNKNWNKSAAFIGRILNLTNLADDFGELAAEIDAGELYKPDETLKTEELAIEVSEAPIISGETATPSGETEDVVEGTEEIIAVEEPIDATTTVVDEPPAPAGEPEPLVVEEGDAVELIQEDPVLTEE